MDGRGLDQDGYIVREGDLDRIQPPFRPVVDAAVRHITEAFTGGRLHSAYLYGSIPRGTATVGVSDFDALLVLADDPTDDDRSAAKRIEAALDRDHAEINGAGIPLVTNRAALSDLERYNLGFFIACLCTPLLGPDLAAQLPRYRPTSLLARETNGDLELALREWRAAATDATTDADVRRLSRRVSRRVVRTGFTLVMPRWGGWTSDLHESAEIFGDYYPGRAEEMHAAARLSSSTSTDQPTLTMILDDLAPWLVAEYRTVHGVKAPRTA